MLNINPFIRGVAIGGALVFAAALDVLYQRLDRMPVGEEGGADGRRRGLFGSGAQTFSIRSARSNVFGTGVLALADSSSLRTFSQTSSRTFAGTLADTS